MVKIGPTFWVLVEQEDFLDLGREEGDYLVEHSLGEGGELRWEEMGRTGGNKKGRFRVEGTPSGV